MSNAMTSYRQMISGTTSTAELFDGVTYQMARRNVGDLFEIIGAPGALLNREVLPGDIWVRRGEAGLAHSGVIVTPELWRDEQLAEAGVAAESLRPGLYATIREGNQAETGRRIADEDGRVMFDTLMLRPRLTEGISRSGITGTYFLSLNGAPIGRLKSAAGGNAVGDVVSSGNAASYYVSKHLASTRYEDIAIEVGLGMDKSFYEWIKAGWTAAPLRKDGSIIAADFNLNSQSQRKFSNALITEVTIPALDSAAKEPAYMTVKFRPESTRDTSASGKVALSAGKQSVWFSPNFRLEIDGLDCTRVSRIDSFAVQAVAIQSSGDRTPGQGSSVPGKINFPNLRITLAETSAATWRNWHNDFVVKGNNASENEKNGSLKFLAADLKKELGRIEFYNLGLYRLARESEIASDVAARMKAELYCQRMDFVV
jgi:hypothetical protein